MVNRDLKYFLLDGDLKILATEGFSVNIDSYKKPYLTMESINGIKTIDDFICKNMVLQKIPHANTIKQIESPLKISIDDPVAEVLFYNNILYIIEQGNKESISSICFKRNVTTAFIEEWCKERLLSDDVIDYNKWELSLFELIPIQRRKSLVLSDLFGSSFSGIELRIYDTNLEDSKKVEHIYSESSEYAWDDLIRINPLDTISLKYTFVLEDGKEIFVYWTDLANYLSRYALTYCSSKQHRPNVIDLCIPKIL